MTPTHSSTANQPQTAPAESSNVVFCLPGDYQRQAEREGTARHWARTEDGADLYGKSREGDENLNHLWWHQLGRAAELAVEWWLGLPRLLDLPYGHHFDTHQPWCVQVKTVQREHAPLRIRVRRATCWHCPYIYVRMLDIGTAIITGWAIGRDVRDHGNKVRFSDGYTAYELPARQLQPLPGPTDLHARMFHRGQHSICPEGRQH